MLKPVDILATRAPMRPALMMPEGFADDSGAE